MPSTALPLLALFLLWGTAATAAAPSCEFPLRLTPAETINLLALDIAPEVLQALGGRPEDLRLLDRNDRPVAWVRRQRHEEKLVRRRYLCPARRELVREIPSGLLETFFVLDKKAGQPALLTVTTAVQDFIQQVRIYGWQSPEWILLKEDGLIFDSTRNLPARNLEVEFDSGNHRRFKVEFERASLERQADVRRLEIERVGSQTTKVTENTVVQTQPFQIADVQFWRTSQVPVSQKARWHSCPQTNFTVATDPVRKQTTVELQPPLYPVCGVTIVTPETNFSRELQVYWLSDGKATLIQRGRVWRLDVPGFRQDESNLEFRPLPSGRLRLLFDDGDAPPLPLTAVAVQIPDFQLLFFTTADALPLRLTAAPGSGEPKYDAIQLIEKALSQPGIAPTPVGLGPMTGTILPPQPEAKTFPRWALYAILASVALVLAYGIFLAMRQIPHD